MPPLLLQLLRPLHPLQQALIRAPWEADLPEHRRPRWARLHMLACPAALPPLHADHLLTTTPVLVTLLQTASLVLDEAQLPSHQLPQDSPHGLLRSRADTRTRQISIRLASGLPLAVLLPEFLLRLKASQQSRLLAFPCLLQERQGHLQRLLDSCHLQVSSLRQALVAGEANHIFQFFGCSSI